MSSPSWRGVKIAVALLVAGILQAAVADAVSMAGGRPDILLVVGLIASMFCGEGSSAGIGFFAGLIHASIAAPPHSGVGSTIVSRTLVCFGVGLLEDRVYSDSVLVALMVVTLGTIAAELLFFAFYPQHNILRWARSVLFTLSWNALLATPCYYCIRLLLGGQRSRAASISGRFP